MLYEMCIQCDERCDGCGRKIGFVGQDLKCGADDCNSEFYWVKSCERCERDVFPPKDEDPIVPDDDRELYNIRVQLMDIKEILSSILDVQKDTVRELRIMSEHMTGMEHHDGKY